MNYVLAAISLLAVAHGTPVAEDRYGCTPGRKSYIAQYDDLPFLEPDPSPIPTPYNGLNYTLFQVDQYDGFIPPTSGNQWTMAYGGSGNISIPDSPSRQTFRLESFSFACVSGIPQPECAISIWGWKTGARRPITRVITYPRLDPGHYVEDFVMNATRFSREWDGLKSVGFSIARADNGGDIYGGLALDDVRYGITTAC